MNGLEVLINFAAVEMPLAARFQNSFNELNLGQVRGRASLDGKRPDQACFSQPMPEAVAA